jgi:DNA-binding NarL/FixJ family response regulator
VQEALKAGAIGYLLKDTGIDELAMAIRQAYAGKASLSPEVTRALIAIATQPAPGSDLTERERQVLALMVDGLSNPQIAVRLQVGNATIKSHVSHLLQKLDAHSRAEAVMLALKYHLVEASDSPPFGG